MEKLLRGIESKREAIVTSRPPAVESSLPDELEPGIAARIKEAAEAEVARRIWHKDPTLWGAADQPEVADRLGWLDGHRRRCEDAVDDLEAFAKRGRRRGRPGRRAARDGRLVAGARGRSARASARRTASRA